MNWKVLLAAAVGSAALAGAAQATTVNISIYNGYDDNGAGMTFTGPATYTGTLPATNTGFYYDFTQTGAIDNLNGDTLFSADITGVLTVATTGTYSVTVGGDDAAYLFLNGGSTPVISDGGIHGYSTVTENLTLHAGANPFAIQYGNGEATQAAVGLNVGSGVTVAGVPEPAAWALMLVGVGALGGALRKRRTQGVALA